MVIMTAGNANMAITNPFAASPRSEQIVRQQAKLVIASQAASAGKYGARASGRQISTKSGGKKMPYSRAAHRQIRPAVSPGGSQHRKPDWGDRRAPASMRHKS